MNAKTVSQYNARWLTPEETATWLAFAEIMTRLPAALNTQMKRRAGISFFEYGVMSLLSEQPDRTLQMGDIAERTSASLSRLSHVASRLERRHLLRRSGRAGPGRHTNATLTDVGYAKVAAAAPSLVSAVRRYLIDALRSDDLVALQRIGLAVAGSIAADWRAPNGPIIERLP